MTDAVATGPTSATASTGEAAAPGADAIVLVGDESPYPPEMRRGTPIIWVILLVVLFATLLAVLVVRGIRHWVALHTGILNGGPDKYYNFWSGFGSDLGEATLITAVGAGLYTGLRKVNCHSKGCWRIGKHQLAGTPYVLCHHHHPGVPSKGASHEHILEQHRRYQESQAAKGR